MKIVAKPIEVVTWTDRSGMIRPMRFRVAGADEEEVVIKVDRVVTRDLEKEAGSKLLFYKCQSCINGGQKLFELKYELSTCKWMLWKI